MQSLLIFVFSTERIFKPNWRESQVSLYSNATIVSRQESNRETKIHMTNQTTLIIFGRQLKDVPKKPILPSGYRMEQLLAIGLIHSASRESIEAGSERMTIIFHWFLSPSIHDMIDWIIAINNSIPDNKQLITNDELTMSLVMAEATYFNQYMMLQDQIHAQGIDHAAGALMHGKELTFITRFSFSSETYSVYKTILSFP